MLGDGFASAFSAVAAAQQRLERLAQPVVATPMTAALTAQQSLFKQVVPNFGAPALNLWTSPFAAFQQQLVEAAPWVAHRSAADKIANVMQDLAEMWTIPRQQGLAHVMGRFWLRAISAARDVARRAVEEVTGQRARTDRLNPARRRGPNRHRKRRSTLVLGFAQQQYVIRELLIRAPGSGGCTASPNRFSGDLACQSKNHPSVPWKTELTTT